MTPVPIQPIRVVEGLARFGVVISRLSTAQEGLTTLEFVSIFPGDVTLELEPTSATNRDQATNVKVSKIEYEDSAPRLVKD
jgi:hypothetical protein